MTALVAEKKSKKMKRSAVEAAAVEPVASESAVVEKKAKKSKKEKKEEVEAETKTEDVVMEEAEKTKKKKSKKSVDESEEPTAVPEEEEMKAPKKSKKEKKAKKEEEAKAVDVPVAAAEAKESKKEEEKEKETSEVPDKKEVIIFGLPYSADEETVKKDFAECGEIISFRMPLDKETQQPKGMAFCEYATAEGLKKALEFNETDYAGRTLRVRICEPDGKGKGKGKDGKGKGKGKGSKGEKPEGCLSVVVKFLSQDTTEEKLWTLFEAEAPSAIKLLTDRDTGESKCLAFVDFEDTSKVDEAVKKNNAELDGKTIMVNFNAPREKGDGKGKGKDGKGKGKDGKGKGKKGKGKKGDSEYAAKAANAGAIATFEGTAKTFDSDSD